MRQAHAEELEMTGNALAGAISLVVQTEKIYIQSHAKTDLTAQKEKLHQELAHLQRFLEGVDKKLGNDKFMQNAKPEVIANEQKKKSDALAKIKSITESLEHAGA